ncbi:MAG: M23 family metallopeptidase [Bacteroidota bacterium]
MTNARRGDIGGADQLLRSLGLLEQGVSDLQNSQLAQHIDEEQNNIARGAADQAAGIVDEEMLEKSDGYRNAVTKGRTVTGFTEATREFAEQLDEVLEQQDSPFLEQRRAEALQLTEQFFENFAADPETGELREFLQSPGAMRYLAEAIGTARPTFEANALQRIEERFNREALSHFSKNVVDQALESGSFDVEAARSLLPDTVSDEETNEALLVSAFNAYDALRADGRREEALKLIAGLRGRTDTPLPDGSPSPLPQAPSVSPEVVREALRLPVQGRVTSTFGKRRHPITGEESNHNGVDIAVPVGTPVPAAMGGEVVRVWNSDRGGLSVKVKYDDGTVAGFAHLSEQPIKEGRFAAGEVIAVTGNTGASTGPHLHYTLTRDGKKIDPQDAEVGKGFETSGSAAPLVRLSDPSADPVTALEASGEVAQIAGLEGVAFSPQQIARINQFYAEASSDLRREWDVAERERHSDNASSLALGLFGVGGARTTPQDLLDAQQRGDISPDGLMTLLRLRESREDRREAQAERAANRQERAERKAREQQVREVSESLIGQLFMEGIQASEVREQTLAVLPLIDDPTVAVSILSNVNAAANAISSATMKSEPVVRQMREFEQLGERRAATVRTLVPNLTAGRYASMEKAYQEAVDVAAGKYAGLVADGTSPEDAALEARIYLNNAEADLVAQINARLSSGQ